MSIFEFIIGFLLAMIFIALAGINHNLDRIARSLQSISLTSRQVIGTLIDEQTVPIMQTDPFARKN